jgi:hypothetical protein
MLQSALASAGNPSALKSDSGWSRLLQWAQPRDGEAVAYESLARTADVLAASYSAGTQPPPQPKETAEGEAAPQPEPLPARLWRMLLLGNAEGSPDLPYDSAPKFDVLRDALPQSVMVMAQSDGGWTIRFGALRAGGKDF